jgi:hypothetical protein
VGLKWMSAVLDSSPGDELTRGGQRGQQKC